MQLDTLAIRNFHCFGADGVTIDTADPVTVLIGADGAGKTPAFKALGCLFGMGGGNRAVGKTDFHPGLVRSIGEAP